MALVIKIKVTPRASRSGFVLAKSGALKALLTSAPEGGKANRELIKLLARSLKYPQSAITIVSGETSRYKTLNLDGPLSYQEILSKLGLAVQKNLLTP